MNHVHHQKTWRIWILWQQRLWTVYCAVIKDRLLLSNTTVNSKYFYKRIYVHYTYIYRLDWIQYGIRNEEAIAFWSQVCQFTRAFDLQKSFHSIVVCWCSYSTHRVIVMLTFQSETFCAVPSIFAMWIVFIIYLLHFVGKCSTIQYFSPHFPSLLNVERCLEFKFRFPPSPFVQLEFYECKTKCLLLFLPLHFYCHCAKKDHSFLT